MKTMGLLFFYLLFFVFIYEVFLREPLFRFMDWMDNVDRSKPSKRVHVDGGEERYSR